MNEKKELLDPVSKNIDSLRKIQQEIASRAVLEDDLDSISRIAGADCAFLEDLIICGIVCLDYESLDVIEKAYVVEKIDFPYIPTYLTFREGKPIANAFAKLKRAPDLLMVDGCGINHPRRAGLATHIGVALDIPTIGIAKKILCGRANIPSRTEDPEVLELEGQQIGWLLKTTKRSNPIIIAPGHRVSMESSLRITRHCLAGYKLPEPTRLAHMYVNEVKKETKNE